MAASTATSTQDAVTVPSSSSSNDNKNNNATLTFDTFHNIIDGKLCDTEFTTHTENPSTLEANPEVPLSTPQDVDRAVAAAERAAETWAEVPWLDRKKAIEAFADALNAHDEEFAHLMVKEMGLPLAASLYDVHWGVEWLRDICKLTLPEKVIDSNPERTVVERYTPIGVGVGIVPWNGPVILACGKIGPALLTGNTLILKPSPYAPYSILKMVEMGQQFFPPGVLQALSGDEELGPWLTAHPGIGKVSFTGSCATGKKVMEACSKHLKRVSMELGGNDPAIVCEDVDPAVAASKIATVALLRSGQLCMAIKRVYVHESIYDAVVEGMARHIQQRAKVGDGFDSDTVVGPLSNRPQYERIKKLLNNIGETGLDVIPSSTNSNTDGNTDSCKDADASGSAEDLKGFFIRPIIVSNPPDDARVVVEEPFGPIVPVMKWSDEADVIRRANATDYGLGASVWSSDLERARRIARRLQAGNVWINTHAELQGSTAFACHKHSGLGSELGEDGIRGWCNVQAVYTRPFAA